MKGRISKIILTPTYNRANTLPELYGSLINQTDKDFKWVIIDDGSTDRTKKYVKKISEEKILDIEYIYQENGGKGRALNKAFSLYSEENAVFIVVDSDDYLTREAISIIGKYLIEYGNMDNIGAFFFHYKTKTGEILKKTGSVISNDKIMTRYEYNNKYVQNDGCVCYLSKAVKKYKYPEFDNEKYIGPTVIQMDMANEYKIVFSPNVIGIAEYLEDGISKTGRKLRINNPEGMLYYSKLMIKSKSKLLTRIKHSISLWVYARITNKQFIEIIKKTDSPILLTLTYLPSKILYLRWKKFI